MGQDSFPENQALSRSRNAIYTLMARIFGDPPTKEIVGETFPAFFREMRVGTDVTHPPLDTIEKELTSQILKEEYEALFQIPTARYVTPFESVYMNGRMMGKSSSEVQEFYRKEGLQRNDGPDSIPDHIALELDFMRFLSQREAEAWTGQDSQLGLYYQRVQKEFLTKHLTTWISKLCNKIRQNARSTFYQNVAIGAEKFIMLDLKELQSYSSEGKGAE